MSLEALVARRIGGATGALKVPVGTAAQRPSASEGMLRFNSETGLLELYDGSSWYFFSPSTDSGYIRASDYGLATGASAATNTTAIEDAIDAANALGGGVVILPPGTYSVNNIATITYSNITLRGSGSGTVGTVLSRNATTGNLLTFTGQHCRVQDITFSGASVKSTAGYVLNVSDTFQFKAENLRIQYCYNGIYMQDGSSLALDKILFRYMLGDSPILMTGTTGNGLYSFRFTEIDGDNPYPVSGGVTGANVATWATSTAFALGKIIKVNGAIWQCSTAGTSAGSGTGPSGTPGTTGANAFSTTVTDGTVQWKWVCQSDLTWLVMDNYAYSGSCDNSSLLNGNRGFVMADTANTGSSQPKWFNSQNLEIDHTWGNCLEVTGGEGLYIGQGWLGSSLRGNGVEIQSTADGEIYIGDGTRIHGNWFSGVVIDNTTVSTMIVNNFVSLNDQSNTGAHGINIAANTDYFVIANNICGKSVQGTGSQQYGIIVQAGNSDHYVIEGNLVASNATGGVSDGGTGVNKSVTGNAI